MSGLFPHREHTDPWFRIGRLEVTTVMFVALTVVVSWLVWVIVPTMTQTLSYSPTLLAGGQVWRLFTWPWAQGLGFTPILTLLMFWYFGTELEGQVGRHQMAGMLVAIWASLTASYTLAAILFSTSAYLGGLSLIEFLVLLVWIAEYPRRPFFFRIPAWVFGAVILGVQVLLMIAYRDYAGLIALMLSLVLAAVFARRAGLLSDYAWIPGRPVKRVPKAAKVPRGQAKQAERRASDRERLDTLLDQINDEGIGSLTDAQRKELLKLRDRLRKG